MEEFLRAKMYLKPLKCTVIGADFSSEPPPPLKFQDHLRSILLQEMEQIQRPEPDSLQRVRDLKTFRPKGDVSVNPSQGALQKRGQVSIGTRGQEGKGLLNSAEPTHI